MTSLLTCSQHEQHEEEAMKFLVSHDKAAGALAVLLQHSCPHFTVLDDRGGSGAWLVEIPGASGLPPKVCDALAPLAVDYFP